jgi:DNA mismatch repair protein MutL
VVERPASVAKELMENAIDAGATAVTVEISHGGMTFLRVTDDGKGIPADELPTAFLRHATSKLKTESDLEAIGTLGFRGEALAAIAAVSRITVLSRPLEAPFGASLSLEGGVPGAVEEAGCPLGTTIVVRDLFFNTPARLKFMKRDAAEGAAVFAVVQRVALSHPEVSIKFLRDGKQELLTPGDGKLQSAVYAVLGRELALGFTEVKGSGEGMEVSGFVSLPACCRASRNYQFFFVNGRLIKSRLMMAALEEAYANQKMVGKFPGCVLHLQTKLSAVDVNVHPAKTEVKFGSDRQVFDTVYHGVLAALDRDRTRPAVQLKAPVPKPQPQPMPLRVHGGDNSLQQTAIEQLRAPAQPVRPAPPAPPAPRPRPPVNITPPEPEPEPEPKPLPKPQPKPKPLPEPEPNCESSWRVAGEVLNTYIIVEQGETIFLIDKHAAHERLNFDRLKAAGYTPMVQTLLSPAVLRPPAEEGAVLLEHQALLDEFGFGVEEFGSGALIVRQAPFDVDPADVESALLEIAQRLLTTGRADPAGARDALLHTMACKAAIKGGWKTSPQELERVAQAVMSGQVKYCPHGRPVAIELTRKELEKQFGRA